MKIAFDFAFRLLKLMVSERSEFPFGCVSAMLGRAWAGKRRVESSGPAATAVLFSGNSVSSRRALFGVPHCLLRCACASLIPSSLADFNELILPRAPRDVESPSSAHQVATLHCSFIRLVQFAFAEEVRSASLSFVRR